MADRKNVAGWLVMAVLLGVALALRLPGFDGRPLWTDELWRATLILDPQFWHAYLFAPTVETAITSPVYAALVKSSALLGVSPDTLRLPSLIPGLLATLLMFALVRKAGGTVALAFFAGLVIALNRSFIGYSNEMKPYMLEVCVHLGCLYAWLTVLAATRPKPRTWAVYFLALAFALLSAPNAVFLLPASGVSLLLHTLANRDRKGSAICIAGFAGLGAFTAFLYYFIWRHGSSNDMLAIWSAGFPGAGGYAGFLTSRLGAMWSAAFFAAPGEAKISLAIFLLLLVWAFATGAFQRPAVRNILVFYPVLLLTLLLVNDLRIWPLGAGRENLFLYAHLIALLFLLAAQAPASRPAAAFGLFCALAALLLLALLPSGRNYYSTQLGLLKTAAPPVERANLVIEDFSATGPVGQQIRENCPTQKTTIVANPYMAQAFSYFVHYDSAHRQGASLLEGPCVQYIALTGVNPAQDNALLASALRAPAPAWFLYTFLGADDVTKFKTFAAGFGSVGAWKRYGESGYFEITPNPMPAP